MLNDTTVIMLAIVITHVQQSEYGLVSRPITTTGGSATTTQQSKQYTNKTNVSEHGRIYIRGASQLVPDDWMIVTKRNTHTHARTHITITEPLCKI